MIKGSERHEGEDRDDHEEESSKGAKSWLGEKIFNHGRNVGDQNKHDPEKKPLEPGETNALYFVLEFVRPENESS